MALHLAVECPKARGSGMLGGVNSEPGPLPGRRREIDTRLDAVRARLQTLRERDVFGHQGWTASPRERVAAAKRYAAEAHAAATRVLASSAEAFRNAAEAHERAASMHERTAAGGIGDVHGHERQAALHRAAAAADWQRAGRVESLLSGHEQAGPAPISSEPRDGVTG